MTFSNFLPCLEAMAVLAILPIALVLLVVYFGKRKRDRLSKWTAIGLKPRIDTWKSLWSWDALAGEYRGRRLTMSWGYTGPSSLLASDWTSLIFRVHEENRTIFRVAVKAPAGTRLAIKPKGFLAGSGALPDPHHAPRMHGIEDQFSIHSDPPHLGARVLAVPRIPALLASDPTIELKGSELQLERPGYFPDPQDVIIVFDTLCDVAELIEQSPTHSALANNSLEPTRPALG